MTDQQKIWEHFQDATGDAFEGALPRYRFLVRRTRPGETVLNIGVGRGGLEALLQARGVEVSCLDPSESTIRRVRETLDLGARARAGVSQAMPFADGRFNVVVMSEVLEHLPDVALEQTLDEVRRVLTPGGRLIGTVPANEHLAAHRTVCPHCGAVFHRWGHEQSFSVDRLRRLLDAHQLVVRVAQTRAFPDWRRPGPANAIKSAVRYALGRLGAPIAAPNIYFEATRQR